MTRSFELKVQKNKEIIFFNSDAWHVLIEEDNRLQNDDDDELMMMMLRA